MRININQLIYDYNTQRGKIRGVSPLKECLTKAELAREMVEAGVINSFQSALNLIQFHQNGKAKSADLELLKFLCRKFDKQVNEILTD